MVRYDNELNIIIAFDSESPFYCLIGVFPPTFRHDLFANIASCFLSLYFRTVVIKAENCALPAKEMMKEIGVRWNLLTDSEKAVWGERAAEDKIRYTRDVRCYALSFLYSLPLLLIR